MRWCFFARWRRRWFVPQKSSRNVRRLSPHPGVFCSRAGSLLLVGTSWLHGGSLRDPPGDYILPGKNVPPGERRRLWEFCPKVPEFPQGCLSGIKGPFRRFLYRGAKLGENVGNGVKVFGLPGNWVFFGVPRGFADHGGYLRFITCAQLKFAQKLAGRLKGAQIIWWAH